jgi:hypothetical protein
LNFLNRDNSGQIQTGPLPTFSKIRLKSSHSAKLEDVRVTVSHNKPKEEIIQAVDRSFTTLFQGTGLPVQLVDQQRSWQGSTMTFSLTTKMGFISTPIKGTVEVTDRDITIDADLGVLERFIPAERARDLISTRVRGLLT